MAMLTIGIATLACLAAGPREVPAVMRAGMQEPLRVFYRGVRLGNPCILALSLAPRAHVEDSTADAIEEPSPCVLGFRIVAIRPGYRGGDDDVEVLVRLALDPKCFSNDDKTTFLLTRFGKHWKIRAEMSGWGPVSEEDRDDRSEPYQSVVGPLPGENRLCRSAPRNGRGGNAEGTARKEALVRVTESIKEVGRQLERAIRARDVEGMMRFTSREGIICGGKTVAHSQVDREMRTAGTPLNAYLFDERTFNERHVRSWRPMALAEFFRVAKESDIAVFFMEGGLDGPCVMYRSLETKARPSVCFRRSGDGWVYAGGPPEAPYTLYPCE